MNKELLLLILVFQASVSGFSKNKDFNILKSRKLKETDYTISIPRGYKIKPTYGVDFIGYEIAQKKLEKDSLRIWLYLGYFPKSLADEGNYVLIDSTYLGILEDSVKYKIYKSNQDYLIQGGFYDNHHIIHTQVFFEESLQLYMWGKVKEYDRIELILRILRTLRIRKKNASS